MSDFHYLTAPSITSPDHEQTLEERVVEMMREMSDDSWYHEAKHHLSVLEKAFTEKDPHLDAPLKLDEAVCLPELGGVLTVDPGSRIPSESFSVKTLRAAVAAGQLAVIRPNSKNLYVTRRTIKDWLEQCHVRENPHDFFSAANVATRAATSLTKPSTSSKTEKNSLALDAALESLKKLRGS